MSSAAGNSEYRTPLAPPSSIIPDPWHSMRSNTSARIALGRTGGSLPTAELLDFQLAHARAKDAVWQEFDALGLARELAGLGWPTAVADSAAESRPAYLQRPDAGRRLSPESRQRLVSQCTAKTPPDLAVIVSDGLSALAAHRQVLPLLAAWWPLLEQSGWRLAQLIVVRHGRVAIQDEVGELLCARAAVILLGERPGLGSPDSLGAYMVFGPRMGRTDAERNCLSNIRPEGLPPAMAAARLHRLLDLALRQQLSGVGLRHHGDEFIRQIHAE
ncbi:MAG: ethanolamine ammonia-lyase subunit EutC [Pirellulales bacterium]